MTRRNRKKSVPTFRDRLPVEQWPALDQTLWRESRRPREVLDRIGPASQWAPATAGKAERAYGQWLKWLRDGAHQSLNGLPQHRVTRDRVRLYSEHLMTVCAASTVKMRLQDLGLMMAALTEGRDFNWISRAASRLKTDSVRNKPARVRPSYEIADLGLRLMKQAEIMVPTWHRPRAVVFRDGLLLALLSYRPIRRKNLANIRIGKHLKAAKGAFSLTFGADETKQRREVRFDVPATLVPYLRRYLEVYRPQLIAAGQHGALAGDCLWISRDGGPSTPEGLAGMIAIRTREAFGRSISPHLFRDCAATTIATDDPGHVYAIAGVLGHATLVTSERHYNQARMNEAAEHYQSVLMKQRRGH